MRLLTSMKILSASALVSAVPFTTRQTIKMVDFPPESEQIHGITQEEAVAIMASPFAQDSGRAGDYPTEGGSTIPDGVRGSCSNNVRPEWDNMSDEGKRAYANAVQCLTKAPPRGIWEEAETLWDEIAHIHSELNTVIHKVDTFLPWHRYYLYAYKTLLEEECGYTGPMPWLNEAKHTGNLRGASIFSPEYFGTLDLRSEDNQGTCVYDGAFTHVLNRQNLTNIQCLARGETVNGDRSSSQITQELVDVCHGINGTTYPQHTQCVEGSIHVHFHVGVGPTMSVVTSAPVDPIFFLHHSFVDWQWKRWQNENDIRSLQIDGCASDPKAEVCAEALTLETKLTTYGLIPDMTVGDFIDTNSDLLCYEYDSY